MQYLISDSTSYRNKWINCYVGLIMRVLICGSISEEQKFDDEAHWELEEESLQGSKIKESNNCSNEQLPMGHM